MLINDESHLLNSFINFDNEIKYFSGVYKK